MKIVILLENQLNLFSTDFDLDLELDLGGLENSNPLLES